MRKLGKYQKWNYEPGEKVIWAGLSGTVIRQDCGEVRIQIHKQKSIEGYIAVAKLLDVRLPYPTRTDPGWVWPEIK